MGSILDNVEMHLVQTIDEVDEFRRWLGERRPVLGADTETSGLSLGHDRIRLAQFGDAKSGWAIPYEEWRGLVRFVLQEYDRPFVWHHAKFDGGMLQKDGLPFPWVRSHDTQPMMFLINSMGPRGLKPGAALYVDPTARVGEKALETAMKKNRWTWATVPIDFPLYWGYGCADVVLTAMTAERLWPHVQKYRDAYDLEMACARVLCDMELRGMRIDKTYCENQIEELTEKLEEVLTRLREYDVNPDAPQQVVKAVQQQGVVLTKRTDKGNLSVDDEVLSALAEHGIAVAKDVLEARGLNKLRKSYFANFLKFSNGDLLNAHIHQLAAKTGRMSITDPPLQTLPKDDPIVRDAFIARDGNMLVMADYDNQELRVMAHFSGDQAMMSAFLEGRDLHAETATRLYGEGFTDKQRGTAKNSMFSKAYGAGEDKFAKTAGIPLAEASSVFATIAQMYPGLNRTMAQVTSAVRGRAGRDPLGWVALIDGRHLMVKSDKAYVGFNALIQGSCAVVLKRALVDLDNAGFGDYLVLPIHDEIIFDIPNDLVEDAVPEIRRVMTRDDFRVPLTVGAKVAPRWGDVYRKNAT